MGSRALEVTILGCITVSIPISFVQGWNIMLTVGLFLYVVIFLISFYRDTKDPFRD